MRKCSCKGCEKRYVGCHSECKEYIEWAAYKKEENEKARKEKWYEWNDYYYIPSRNKGKTKKI